MSFIGNRIIGGDVGPGGAGLGSAIMDTETANLQWYFPCNDASGGAAEAIEPSNGITLVTGGGGGITHGVEGASVEAGDAIQIPLLNSLERDSGDSEFANIFDSAGGFTFGMLVRADTVADTAGVFQANDTGTTTRFILRMETGGLVFIGLLIGGENDNIVNVGTSNTFEEDVWHWVFVRVSAAGSIDLFKDSTKSTAVGSNNSGTGTDGTLTNFEVGESGTEHSAITVQHICGWDTPLSDQQIADIVNATDHL